MKTWTRLLFCATALTAVCATPAMAAGLDEPVAFNIAPGSLDEALIAYSSQADLQVISASNAVRGKQTRGVEGARSACDSGWNRNTTPAGGEPRGSAVSGAVVGGSCVAEGLRCSRE